MAESFSATLIEDGDDLFLPLSPELLAELKWRTGDTIRFSEVNGEIVMKKVFYREKIISNSIICRSCDDVIESKHTHDFKWCKCKLVAVDGGKSYLKRTGNLHNFLDVSVVEKEEREPYDWEV